jgi:hypothetical protein
LTDRSHSGIFLCGLSERNLMNRQVALCFALLLTIATSAGAAVLPWTSVIDGAQETPPVVTPATGSAFGTYDTDTNLLTWTITFSGLIGTTNNSHFHGPAAVGVGPAGVRLAIPFTAGVTGDTLMGSGTVADEAQEAELLAGLWYINIHSTFAPGGEIRGQVSVVPEPATFALAGAALAGLCLLRRKSTR